MISGHAREFDVSPIAVTAEEVIRPQLRFDDLVDTDHGEAINSVAIKVYEMPTYRDVTTDILHGSATVYSEYVEQGFRNFVDDKVYLVTVKATLYAYGVKVRVLENYFSLCCLL